MEEEEQAIRLPMLLEMLIEHHTPKQAGAVRLQIAHVTVGTIRPIFYQLSCDDTIVEEKPVSRSGLAHFYVRKAGKYKMIGIWKDGSKDETQIIELTDGMFTADGFDGLNQELRDKAQQQRLANTRPAVIKKKGWFS